MSKLTECIFNLAAAITIVMVYSGCSLLLQEAGFPPPLPTTPEEVNDYWQEALPTEPDQTWRDTFSNDELFKVVHGASCVDAISAATEDNAGEIHYGVRVDESIQTAGYNTATVYLNGWSLVYKNTDHHILGLSTGIVDIEQNDNGLRWKAGGILSDRHGGDAFQWCYWYTALLWNSHPFNLDAIPYDTDDGANLTFLTPGSNNGLRVLDNSLYQLEDDPAALLPRGFGLMWYDYEDDHHLNRFALDYGDSSFFTNTSDGGDAWWQFKTIFRDKHLPDPDYIAAQTVSILHGDSVKVREQDFAIFPGQQNGAPGTGHHDVISQTIVEENLPFDYAVPVLAGWDIGINSNGDSHIKAIGVWIESFSYDKDAGTLTYTIKSAFHDKHDDGGIFNDRYGAKTPRYKVSILGFNPLGIIIQNPTGGTTGTVNEDPAPPTPTTTVPGTTTGTTLDPISSPVSQPPLGNIILKGTLQRETLSR